MKTGVPGALVQYCGHDGYFIADIWVVGNCNVVRANGKVDAGKLIRPADGATHHVSDYPMPGFWRPDLGVFVVPESQVTKISNPPINRSKGKVVKS